MMFDNEYYIGIDFDDTITLNPDMWLRIMSIFEQNGFNVVIVTWRYPHEYPQDLQFLVDKGYKVYYTGRLDKKMFMANKGINIDIMIDDFPESWCFSMDNMTGKLYRSE